MRQELQINRKVFFREKRSTKNLSSLISGLCVIMFFSLMVSFIGPDLYAQTGDQEPFITIWQTDNEGESDDDQISIPIEGSGYDITIEWGDGNQTEWKDGDSIENLTHTYSSPGTYTVYIFGDFPRIYFNGEGDMDKILSVEHWGDIEWQTMDRAFMGASNLEITAMDAPDLSAVTSMARMFRDATSLNSDLSHWDVSTVTSMIHLFFNAQSFNGEIGSWDTGNVENMSWMFTGAEAFNRDVSAWNTSSVNRMREMFYQAGSFDQDISSWDVSNVTDMTRMFRDAGQFSADLSDWDISNVMRLESTFQNAESFNHSLSEWDVSSVVSMFGMFSNSGLTPGNYDNTLIGWADQDLQTDVTLGANSMEYCGAVAARQTLIDKFNWSVEGDSVVPACEGAFVTRWHTSADGEEITIPTEGGGYSYSVYWGDGAETSNVTGDASHTYDKEGTYSVAIKGDFPRIYFNNEGDNEKITDVVQWGDISWESMEWAFYGTSNLEIRATDTPDLSNVSSLQGMFSGSGISGTTGNWAWETETISNFRHLFFLARAFNGDISGWNTSEVTSMQQMFWGASAFNQNIGEWDVSNVEIISGMFGRAVAFDQDIGDWDITNVNSFNQMFSGATSFNQDLNNWDVSNASNFNAMFTGATNFNGDVSDWDVSGATNFNNMFRNAHSFNQDLSEWNVSSATRMNAMFQNAASFNQSLGAWDIENVTSMNFESRGFLDNSGLTAENYDKTLTGWSKLQLQSDVEMGAEGLLYCDASEARSHIINEFNWTITGDRNCFDGEPFITIWQTDLDGDSDNNQITIPTADTDNEYSYNIYWESVDDSSVNGTMNEIDGDQTVTFPEAGTYRVEITGKFPQIYFNNEGDKDKVLEVEQWGDIQWQSMAQAFRGAGNLEITAEDSPDLSRVNTLEHMFRGSGITGTVGNWDWDVSTITNFSYLFSGAHDFNGDISGWVTSSATRMDRLFEFNRVFDQDISDWDVSSVTYMVRMFTGAREFNQNLNSWDVSQVTNFTGMFQATHKFNQDLNDWDLSSANWLQSMFAFTQSFNGDITGWDVSGVSRFNTMFREAVSFNRDISGWDVSGAYRMFGMFEGAKSFDQNLGSWNVERVREFGHETLGFLDRSGLSRENYDALLEGWSQLNLWDSQTIGAEGVLYCDGAEARQSIIDDFGWSFTGDSEQCGLILATPVLTGPDDEAIDLPLTLTLEWEAVSDAESYTVQWSLSEEFEIDTEEKKIDSDSKTEISGLDEQTGYYWRVKAVAADTESEWSETWQFTTMMLTSTDPEDTAPKAFELAQNYPNPFNPATQIRFAMPEHGHATLHIYNTLGRRVATLVNEPRNAGWHEVSFDASNLSSGIYFYRLQAGSHTQTRQMMLIK